MRLFDKFVTTFRSRERFASVDWDSVTVLAADDTFRSLSGESFNEDNVNKRESDYPFSRPPWAVTFVESNVPRGSESLDVYGQFPRQVGCLVAPGDIRETNELSGYARTAVENGRVSSGFICSYVLNLNELIGYSPCLGAFTIDEAGNTSFAVPVLQRAVDTPLWMSHIFHCMLMSFTFANCRNVEIEDVTNHLQPSPKIRRRLNLPEVKRYTLKIAGHHSRPSREYNEGPQGVMPFHLCRGHFATYTADKPMFGNPKLVGRYWHPPHMKGKKERGEIMKDYAIDGGMV
jgi:hypothetical protein